MRSTERNGAAALTPLEQYVARVRRRWLVIVLVAAIGGLVSGIWSISVATTTWTGTTALTTQSQNRSPEQDAVLALGYVDYFNKETYQQLLRAEAAIPADVQLSAKTGATSPVFYIDATGPSEDAVRSAAAAATENFRNDIRKSLMIERQQAAADLQAEIDDNVRVLQQPERTDAEKNVILDQIRSLQGRLTELEADNTNQIKQLQPVPGMASAKPSPAADIAVGVVGGGILGVLVAVLLVAVDSRLRSAGDTEQRLSLVTLADLCGSADPVVRRRKLANMANALNLSDAGGTTVVGVVAARRSSASARLARELAALLAARQTNTTLLMADAQGTGDQTLAGLRGLTDLLAGHSTLRRLELHDPVGYRIVPPGRNDVGESFTAFQPGRLRNVLKQIAMDTDVVVIDVPPVLDASESQLISAMADHVLVVVEAGVSRVADVREALALLAAVDAPISGAVIDLSTTEDEPESITRAIPVQAQVPDEPIGTPPSSSTTPPPQPTTVAAAPTVTIRTRPTPYPRPAVPSTNVLDGAGTGGGSNNGRA